MGLLVAVGGLPGVGKTTVSTQITDRLDAVRLRTDVLRKELFDTPTYSATETQTVYQMLYDRTGKHLAADRPVVLDATFRRRSQRDRLATLAETHQAAFQFVHVGCDDAVVRRRLATRKGDASDADVAIYEQLKEEFESVRREHIQIDNSGAAVETRLQVERAFRTE